MSQIKDPPENGPCIYEVIFVTSTSYASSLWYEPKSIQRANKLKQSYLDITGAKCTYCHGRNVRHVLSIVLSRSRNIIGRTKVKCKASLRIPPKRYCSILKFTLSGTGYVDGYNRKNNFASSNLLMRLL